MGKKLKISSYQKQIIVGKLLGDGHLETINQRTFRLKIEHSISQKDYVDWLYTQLHTLASSQPQEKKQLVRNKIYRKYWFNSHYSASLRFYHQQFYQNRRKIVPSLIHKWLTPLSLTVWYMDDGSAKSPHHRAKIINTQSFDQTSLHRLRQALHRNFGLKTKLRKQKEGWQIYILATEVKKFIKIIKPYILPMFSYKI